MMEPALVNCARAKLRLTEAACAMFWTLSNPEAPPVWEGRRHCHGCPAGAARAGVELDAWQSVRESFAPICARCRRTATRLIRKSLCVSCYNREREVRCGRNARGSAPRFVAEHLCPATAIMVAGNAVERIDRDLSAGVIELMIESGRRVTAPVMFGWAPPPGMAA